MQTACNVFSHVFDPIMIAFLSTSLNRARYWGLDSLSIRGIGKAITINCQGASGNLRCKRTKIRYSRDLSRVSPVVLASREGEKNTGSLPRFREYMYTLWSSTRVLLVYTFTRAERSFYNRLKRVLSLLVLEIK